MNFVLCCLCQREVSILANRSRFLSLLLVGSCGGFPIGQRESELRVCAAGATVEGFDIYHGDAVDWSRAKAGMAFVYIKATEGATFADPSFAAHWQSSGAVGLLHGAYHFFRPAGDPIAQADFFVKAVGGWHPGELPPALDLEVADGLAEMEVEDRALKFLSRVEASAGRRPIIYTSKRHVTSVAPAALADYPLWDANWTSLCPDLPVQWPTWSFWQYDGMGVVDGVNGSKAATDRDRFNGSLDELMAFANPPAPIDGGSPPSDASTRATVEDAGTADSGSDGSSDDNAANVASIQVHGGCSIAGRTPGSLMISLLAVAALIARRKRPRPVH